MAAAARPFLSTNSIAPTSYAQMHPEVAEPATPANPANPSSLSLRPETAATNSPPEVIPPGSGIFPDTAPPPSALAPTEDLAAHLLVVYNTADPDSKSLAEYYAAQRNIPAERVLAVTAPISEEITRQQFDDTLRTPITSYLLQKDWMARETQRVRVGSRYLDLLVATRNDIWAIVLMRGVPVRIAPDPSDIDSMEYDPSLQTNAAAVDSELALLPVFGLPKGGFVPNIFFDNPVAGISRVGPELARNMILVTRLDGPKASDVRRMIDDTIFAEKNRLAGLAVVDSRGLTDPNSGYTIGDVWLRDAHDMLVKDGWPVKFDDKPDVLPPTDPCNQVALYLGWYTQDAFGPWIAAPNRFVRGAIAYHLHSFSAGTIRSTTSNWVGPLITHGAAATMGTVFEPYLAFTPHEDVFTRRLLQGDYFAEAAYAAEPALSWMLTVVGDPLYRPFRKPLDAALADAGTPRTAHDDWLLLQKVNREIVASQIEARTDSLRTALEIPGAGPVAEEGLGDLLEQSSDPTAPAAAAESYEKAYDLETEPIDKMRVGLKLTDHYAQHDSNTRAQGERAKLWAADADAAKRFGVPAPVLPTQLMPVSHADNTPPSSGPRPGTGDSPLLPQLPKPTPLPQPKQ
jgi:uncharacterized protein (TIGR03790 family)